MKTKNNIIYYVTAPFYYLYRALDFIFIKWESRLIPRIFAALASVYAIINWIRSGPYYKDIPGWTNALILVILILIGYKLLHVASCIAAIIVNKLLFRIANRHVVMAEVIAQTDPEQMNLDDLIKWGREQRAGRTIRKATIYR